MANIEKINNALSNLEINKKYLEYQLTKYPEREDLLDQLNETFEQIIALQNLKSDTIKEQRKLEQQAKWDLLKP
jgi:predicted nuclease with TOPRIM domain